MFRQIFLLLIINSSAQCLFNTTDEVLQEINLKRIDVSKNIEFIIYDRYGISTDKYEVCKTSDKFAILIHGWNESCDEPWMKSLIKSKTDFFYVPINSNSSFHKI